MKQATPAPRFTVEAIDLFERDVVLRMPFRFGVVTLTRAPQAYARARIRLADGRIGEGMAAELLAPKWFDKNPAVSNDDNFEQLRAALGIARTLYLDDSEDTGFGRFVRHYPAQVDRAGARGLNGLVALYGPALLDRAVLDALCRALGLPFHEAVQRNLVGLGPTDLCPDLAGFDFDAFLAGLKPAATIAARHTVGLVDPIVRSDQTERVGDGLPETLDEVVAAYGQRWFKLKVAGDIEADVERLARIAAVLDRIEGGYRCSLDGNEQYDDIEGVLSLWRRMHAEPRLARLCASVAFVEQPIKRQTALDRDVGALSSETPVIVDESDDALDAFVRARDMGYRGVSSKTCKGLYKSLVNAARCAAWNRETPGRYLMSAEDLTIQAGISLQQDLALVSLLGIGHVERNGHHYVDGMAALSPQEQQRFLDAHPDLYERSHGAVRVRIRGGDLAIGSLGGPGFASGAAPDWASMRAMTTTMSSVDRPLSVALGAPPGLGQRLATAFVYYLPSILVILGLLVLWQLVVMLLGVKEYILPTPLAAFKALFNPNYRWTANFLATLYAVLGAFVLSAVLGVLLAIVIVWNDLLLRTVMPVLILFNTLPKIALAPLFVVWMGYGIWPNIIIGTTIAFFPMVVNTAVGLASAEPEMLDLVRTLKAGRWQVLKKIRIPNAIPYIFVGLKLNATMSVIGALVGEFVASERGLGSLIITSGVTMETAPIFASLMLISALGLVLYGLVVLVEQIVAPWATRDDTTP